MRLRLLLVLVLLLATVPRAFAEPAPIFVHKVFGLVDEVPQLAVGPDGVYAADPNHDRVAVFDATSGTLIRNIYEDTGLFIYEPSGVVLASDGALFIAQLNLSNVLKVVNNAVVLTISGPGAGPGKVQNPTNLALSPDGSVLYVADTGGHHITRFNTATGASMGRFGVLGSAPGQFNHPFGIAINALGDIFVGDRDNHRIQHFSAAGGFIDEWGGLGSGPGEFNQVGGLAFDPQGNLLAVDQGNRRVQKFRPDGTFLLDWGNAGPLDQQFTHPIGIAAVGASRVWTSDEAYNPSIFVFETFATPAIARSWGSIKADYR